MNYIEILHKRIMDEKGLKKLLHRIIFKMVKPFLIELTDCLDCFENDKIKIEQNQHRLDVLETRLEGFENEKIKIKQNQKRLDILESRLTGYEDVNSSYTDIESQLKVFEVMLTDGVELKIQELLKK